MVLLIASTAQPDWRDLQLLHPDSRITIALADGKYVSGRFRTWSPAAMEVPHRKEPECFTQRTSAEYLCSRKALGGEGPGLGRWPASELLSLLGRASQGYHRPQ